MSTISANAQTVKQDWYIIDVSDKVLGRVATRIAHRLRGKHKAIYTPHVDTGDYIVVINADKIRVTGKKMTDKLYYRHTGYPGGIKATPFKNMLADKPIEVLQKAVQGMLPKGPLGRDMFRKLKVYAGTEHPHAAQQPQVWQEEC
jgi:large subunit ribosomal protein L13